MCNDTACNCKRAKTEQKRGLILFDSLNKINGERQDSYGTPEDSFTLIANLWTAYLGSQLNHALTAHDTAMLMTLFKAARIRTGAGHMDSYSDGGGYLGLAADMAGYNAELCEPDDVEYEPTFDAVKPFTIGGEEWDRMQKTLNEKAKEIADRLYTVRESLIKDPVGEEYAREAGMTASENEEAIMRRLSAFPPYMFRFIRPNRG